MTARRYDTPALAFAAGAAACLLLSVLAFFVVKPTRLLYVADY